MHLHSLYCLRSLACTPFTTPANFRCRPLSSAELHVDDILKTCNIKAFLISTFKFRNTSKARSPSHNTSKALGSMVLCVELLVDVTLSTLTKRFILSKFPKPMKSRTGGEGRCNSFSFLQPAVTNDRIIRAVALQSIQNMFPGSSLPFCRH